jgi:hypothetical protein
MRNSFNGFSGVKRGGRWEVLGVPLFCSRSTKANGMGTRVDLRANFSVAHLSPAQRVVNLLLNAAMQWVGVA